ncbi:MAG: hypothetical protein ACOCVY_02895, partial [Patescibacteria group bacterium]
MLQKSVLRTIKFFDMFDYPMTAPEVWEYLDVECDPGDVYETLLQEKSRIQKQDGFFFLSGRQELVDTRKKRYNYSDKKIKKTKRVGHVFKYIPGIKTMAISNLIGTHNLRYEGDLDIFIITSSGRLWSVRFFCVLITKLLRLRPTPAKQKDKICLNFFLSEDRMNVQDLKLEKDVYFDHWMAGLVPVYDQDNTFSEFLKANNWMREKFPNQCFGYGGDRSQIKEGANPFIIKLFDVLFCRHQNIFKNIQLRFLSHGLKKLMNQGTQVVIDDNILKLHTHDRRKEFR